MKKYNCNSCNYHTDRLFNYNKHLKTIRHHKKSEIPQFPSPIPQFDSPLAKTTFSCNYCHYVTKRKDNYTRHILSCENKIKSDNKKDLVIEKLLEEIQLLNQEVKKENSTSNKSKDEQITQLTETINELKTQCKMDILSSENKLLKEHDKQVTTTNNAIGNHNNIHNVTQYIINNYPNAPNLKPIEHIEDIEKYISSDFNNSYANLIQDHYVKDIEPKDRSIWLVDSARDKYLTRLNDTWKIDMNGEQFCNLINNALSKALFQGKAILDENQDHVSKSIVLMELLIYVAQQQKLPKSKKSNFLLQNTI